MGIKCPKPVKVANRIVVLMGVRVTQALMAAIQLTMASVRLIAGNRCWSIKPKVAPTKNKGMMNPPLQPDVTVIEIARILKASMANSRLRDRVPANNPLIP